MFTLPSSDSSIATGVIQITGRGPPIHSHAISIIIDTGLSRLPAVHAQHGRVTDARERVVAAPTPLPFRINVRCAEPREVIF